MKCHVYSRVELVVYVVGVNEAHHPFAEALAPAEVRKVKHHMEGKPFAHMGAKNVLYVERIGCIAVHRDKMPLFTRAQRRASALNLEYAEVAREPT